MVKRKAEGVQRRGKAPAQPPPTRQPPPPAQDDGSDSDVCEIVSPPPSTNRQPRRRQPPQQPASALNSSSALSSQPQARPPAGLLSMMPAGFGLAPPGGAGFGFPQHPAFAPLQASSGYNPFLCDPRLLPSAVGLQRGYVGGFPVSPAGGASSGGSSSGSTPVGAASPRVRVREGSAAQEVKEEPEDPLRPTPDEVAMVETLRRYGVTTPDAVHCLRKCGNRVEVALQLAMDIAKTRAENKAMDNARLESEKEKDLAAERQSSEDKTLVLLGEVLPHFPKSLLLDPQDGCTIFRQFVERLSPKDGMCTQALCTFREKAVTLLFLERDSFRHYPENNCQIREYFRKLSQRLQEPGAPGGEAEGTAGASAQDHETNHFTARVGKEVEALQHILYKFPTTPGGVPDAFLEHREGDVATLEKDGVEEDTDRDHLARRKDPVVYTIDD